MHHFFLIINSDFPIAVTIDEDHTLHMIVLENVNFDQNIRGI